MLNKNVIIPHKWKISPVIRFFVLMFAFKVKAAPFAAAKVNALHFLFALGPSFTAARRRVGKTSRHLLFKPALIKMICCKPKHS